MMNKNDTGSQRGVVERGQIVESGQNGFTVMSLDRNGIITLPMKPITDTLELSIGDRVYFFVFPDGTGRIICTM